MSDQYNNFDNSQNGGYQNGPHNPYPQQGLISAPKSKILAGILGILLGALGIHNFYLGFIAKGAIQLSLTGLSIITLGLLFPLAFAASIWGLIEGVMILVSKPGDSFHKDAQGVELID